MKIVLISENNGKVTFLDVEDKMIGGDVEQWLDSHGYDTDEYFYFTSDEEYVPIDFHKYSIDEETGKVETTTYHERLRCAPLQVRIHDFLAREKAEFIETLKEKGECVDGGYEVHFEADKPIVAAYLHDEPCDVMVNAVRVDKDGHIIILCYDKEGIGDEVELCDEDLFAEHLSEITDAL